MVLEVVGVIFLFFPGGDQYGKARAVGYFWRGAGYGYPGIAYCDGQLYKEKNENDAREYFHIIE